MQKVLAVGFALFVSASTAFAASPMPRVRSTVMDISASAAGCGMNGDTPQCVFLTVNGRVTAEKSEGGFSATILSPDRSSVTVSANPVPDLLLVGENDLSIDVNLSSLSPATLIISRCDTTGECGQGTFADLPSNLLVRFQWSLLQIDPSSGSFSGSFVSRDGDKYSVRGSVTEGSARGAGAILGVEINVGGVSGGSPTGPVSGFVARLKKVVRTGFYPQIDNAFPPSVEFLHGRIMTPLPPAIGPLP